MDTSVCLNENSFKREYTGTVFRVMCQLAQLEFLKKLT